MLKAFRNFSQHCEQISKVPGYLRTTRYKLLYYRTNAQSRQLKGLPPREGDHAIQEPPSWLAIHEFSREDLDFPKLMATAETEISKEILGTATKTETPVYRFTQSYGDGKFFN